MAKQFISFLINHIRFKKEPFVWLLLCFITFSITLVLFIGEFGFLIAICIVGFLSGSLTKNTEEGITTAVFSIVFGDLFLFSFLQSFDTEIRTFLPFHNFSLLQFLLTIIIPSVIFISAFAALGASTQGQRISQFVLRERSMMVIDSYCPFCGMYVSPSDKYCPNCGISLLDLEE